MKLLTPKSDLVFKKLFTTDPELLTSLLNAVLKLPKSRRITKVVVTNPQILAEDLTKKFILLDILATAADGSQYNIEMQARQYVFYPKRMVYYVAKLYAGQLQLGEDYRLLKPVIGIHFVDYEMYPKRSAFHFCFEFRERHYRRLRLTKDLSLHLLELPKFEKHLAQVDHNELSEWLHFFKNAPEEVNQTMRTYYQTPVIHRAFDVLERLSADAQMRQQFEAREKALKDEVSILWETRQLGRKEGRQEGALDTAREMVFSALEGRFRQLPDSMTQTLQTLNRLEVLKRLLNSVFQCPYLETFQATLTQLTKDSS